jgi:hypothetical protein
MNVIATQSGPFAFDGIHVVQISEGDEFEGKRAKALKAKGWAVDADDDEAILKAAAASADADDNTDADDAGDDNAEALAEAEKKVADLHEAAENAAVELGEDPDNSSLKGKLTKARKALTKAQDDLEALKAE